MKSANSFCLILTIWKSLLLSAGQLLSVSLDVDNKSLLLILTDYQLPRLCFHAATLSKYKNSSKYLHIFVTIFSLFYPFCQYIFRKKYTIAIRIYCFQYIKISVTNSH